MDIFANGKTTQDRTQVLVPVAPDVRVAGKKIKALCDGINEAVSNFNAAAFFGDVIPDVIESCFGLG
jgi:hypothetical protein